MTDTFYQLLALAAFLIGLMLGMVLGGATERGYQRTYQSAYDHARRSHGRQHRRSVHSTTDRIEQAALAADEAPSRNWSTVLPPDVNAQLRGSLDPDPDYPKSRRLPEVTNR